MAPETPNNVMRDEELVVVQDYNDTDDDSVAVRLAAQSLSVSDGGESSLYGMKKKKKKDVERFDCNEDGGVSFDGQKLCSNHSVVLQQQQQQQLHEYEELLGRVFDLLHEKNPELASRDRQRIVMMPPKVVREGTKKTVLANFIDYCNSMHRQPDHLMAFLLTELGTTGSLDGQQRLVVKGRFAPKNFETILRQYMNEYVICFGCKSTDTLLSKENRLFILRCEKCASQRSVAPIKAGFVARVGPRK